MLFTSKAWVLLEFKASIPQVDLPKMTSHLGHFQAAPICRWFVEISSWYYMQSMQLAIGEHVKKNIKPQSVEVVHDFSEILNRKGQVTLVV